MTHTHTTHTGCLRCEPGRRVAHRPSRNAESLVGWRSNPSLLLWRCCKSSTSRCAPGLRLARAGPLCWSRCSKDGFDRSHTVEYGAKRGSFSLFLLPRRTFLMFCLRGPRDLPLPRYFSTGLHSIWTSGFWRLLHFDQHVSMFSIFDRPMLI